MFTRFDRSFHRGKDRERLSLSFKVRSTSGILKRYPTSNLISGLGCRSAISKRRFCPIWLGSPRKPMPKPKVQKRDALNLNGMAIRQNPPDAFRQIFNQGPVIQSHLPILGKAWVATSWTAVADLLRNSETFVRDPRLAGRKNFAWMQVLLPRKIQRLFLS